MEIGKPEREFTTEPAQDPFQKPVETPAPALPEPVPAETEPVKVPAGT
jgi:hypothetical protein